MKVSKNTIFRLLIAPLLAFGLVETSSAITCNLTDVQIDSAFESELGGINAFSCGEGSTSQDFTPDSPIDRSTWSVNLDNAGGMNDWLWYERAEEVTEMNPDGHDGNTSLIDLMSSPIGDDINSGTFELTSSGPLLIVLKSDQFNYHWYMWEDVQGTVSGIWDASAIFVNEMDVEQDVSHITAYQKDDERFPPVPVPAAVWLFGSGLLGLIGVARRRKSS